MKDKGLVQWLICVALVALIGSNVYFAILARQEHQAQIERRAAYEEHAQRLQEIHASEYHVIDGAYDSYRTDAYNISIDRIAEQQLIAAEYQMVLLQVIARQNAEMIELMLVAGP